MISKVIIGKTFYGACRYVCMDERRSVVLFSEGIRAYDYKLMAADFERQHSFHASLSRPVFHGILSFYPGEKLQDQLMATIAKEYMEEMKITNTQFVIAKHIDKNHLHLHILANLVNNKEEVIKDNWIGLQGKKVAQKLTLKYGLKEALSKNISATNLEALNEKEANRYIIYQAILEVLPHVKSLADLKELLMKQKIETLFKYRNGTTDLQGISFSLGQFKYKGSEVDRMFSINNLIRTIHLKQRQIPLLSKTGANSGLLPKKDRSTSHTLYSSKNLLAELVQAHKAGTADLSQPLLPKKRKRRSRGLN